MKSLRFILLFLPLTCGALNNTVSITISGNAYTDQIALRFDSAGSTSYNSNLDAWKLFSPVLEVPQIYVRTAPQEPLSVYTMPLSSLDTIVDLYVHIGTPGTYKIQAGFPGNFASGTCLQLEDNMDGHFYTLDTSSNSFQFSKACDSLPRFRIHFHNAPHISALPVSCFGSMNGRVLIQASGNSSWSGSLLDSSGKIASSIPAFRMGDTIDKLGAGLYLLSIVNILGCSLSEPVRIQAPPILSAQFAPADSLHIAGTGEPVIFSNHSVNALSYAWNFGDSSSSYQSVPQHIYYKSGRYTVQLTATNGFCKASETRTIDIRDFTTGTSNQESNSGVKIFYAAGVLELRNNTGIEIPFETKIFDLQGRIVLAFKSSVSEVYRFTLPPAPSSTYVVEVNAGQSLSRKKIILSGGF
jgi:hypothetical protein